MMRLSKVPMKFREATIEDIKALHAIRIAVKENVLNTPSMVTEQDYMNFLTLHGKGWLCEKSGHIVGFGIIDTLQNNIWALFVHPDFEKKGIGKKLQQIILDWFFDQSENTLWLGTAPNTRAENFYRSSGWKEIGRRENGEIKFEMSRNDWKKYRAMDQ